MLTQPRLSELLALFPTRRIAVLGDFFLDKYQEIDPSLAEVSVETGLTAHQVVRKWSSPGAAGTVVNNLHGLGAGRICPIGFSGDDGEGYELRRGLESQGCDLSGFLIRPDLFTPVYHKTMERGKTGLAAERERFDTQNRSPLPLALEDDLKARIDSLWVSVDAFIVADQVQEEGCGVLTQRVRSHLLSKTQSDPSKILLVDSRRRIGLYRGLFAKPNEAECVRAVEPKPTATDPHELYDDETILRCCHKLWQQLAKPVFVTRGSRGIWIFDGTSVTQVPGVQVPGPTDPTGAGDSAMSGIAMALASRATLAEAAVLGCLVASITVQQLGTTGFATPEQLTPRLLLWEQQGGVQWPVVPPRAGQ